MDAVEARRRRGRVCLRLLYLEEKGRKVDRHRRSEMIEKRSRIRNGSCRYLEAHPREGGPGLCPSSLVMQGCLPRRGALLSVFCRCVVIR